MGKKKPKNDVPEELPEYLQSLVDRARKNKSPAPLGEELAQLPNLWPLMRAELVLAPPVGKETEAKLKWRSPMLSIWWDQALGCWLLSVKDQVLGVSARCELRSLLTAIVDAEEQLANGQAAIKSLEK